MDTLMTAKEVAEHYNQLNEDLELTPRQVHYARRTNKLYAVRVGWQWLFPEARLPKEWPVRLKRKRVA